MSADFLQVLGERVVVFDGSMGATILSMQADGKLSPDDFGGYPDCTEALLLSKPSAVAELHASFLEIGCDAVETDTFNGADYMLAEHGLAEKAYEINFKAAQVARGVCNDFSTRDRPRFVVGSLGPGTKTVIRKEGFNSMPFDEMYAAYKHQARALIDGGADVLLVETCFDILQCKCAVIACYDATREAGRRVPLMAQVTVETFGTLLLGTEMLAAITTLEMLPVDVIGINCATGPDLMHDHVRTLSRYCSKYLSVLPNAGLPERDASGKSCFPLTPEELKHWQNRFVTEYGVNIVGGCCGTTTAHLKGVVDAVWGTKPAIRNVEHVPAASSLYIAQPYDQELSVMIVGERTNATGSKKFRDLLLANDLDGIEAMARDQEREGAHMLDLCVDYVGRDRVEDVKPIADKIAGLLRIPVMVDSDSGDERVYEEALKRLPGKCLVNSINFEDGGKEGRQSLAGMPQIWGRGGLFDHRRIGPTARCRGQAARSAPPLPRGS